MKTTAQQFLRFTIFMLLATVVFVSACNKKKGDGVPLPEEEVPVNEEILSGTISEPRVLVNRVADPNQYDYKVPVSVVIASTVTVMPGVVIEMGPGAKITVSSTGQFKCLGTPDSNVVITGQQKNPGYWDYVSIGSYDTSNTFAFTVIEYGGGNPNLESSVILNGNSILKMYSSKIRYSERYGLMVTQKDSRLLHFNDNNISDCGYAPLYINSSQMGSLNESTILSQQNTFNYIEVKGSDIATPQTWKKTDVPFYMTDVTTILAQHNIEPGTRLMFGPAGRILVEETGSLAAIGTETDSIYFYGAQTIAGYWDCILFLSQNPNNEFKYVSLRHAGGYWYWNAAIYLQDAYFKISYCTIANSARWGIYRNGIYQFVNGGFNVFADNGHGPVGP